MAQTGTPAISVSTVSMRARSAWLRTAELLESDRSGLLLAGIGVLVLLLSTVAALVSMPGRPLVVLTSSLGAALGMVAGLAWNYDRRAVPWVTGASSVGLLGVYVATTYAATPTAVWLFAYLVPAIGLARGPLVGALAGFLAAPVLHLVETGLIFDPLDPQGPFGVLILIALGAVPGHLMGVARHRRVALDAELRRAIGLLDDAERARAGEHAANEQSVFMLARAAEARDGTTGAHIHHVRDLATELAAATGADARRAELVGWSAMLHDVGKLRVPDRILLKPGRLDAEEWETIQRHSVWGEELLEGGAHFQLARGIARWHHENWDGTGYPDRIAGSTIPFEARIVRIVDVYDALRSERPYKAAWTEDEALEELRRLRGIHFDPELTDLFMQLRGA